MPFKLEHHKHILTVLHALNPEFFREIGASFGGGTLLALQYGEYRWSKDIDFLCPLGSGYRRLRREVAQQGYGALFADQSSITLPRDIKADQYGIRFAVLVGETLIKFEIIAEARISLNPPETHDWCPVPCLDFADCCTEKLLSNADRWSDSSVESRDLIDLSVLRLQAAIPEMAYSKAENAYPVVEPLGKAIKQFQSKESYRNKCFRALRIADRASVLDGLDLLAQDCGLGATERKFGENSGDLWPAGSAQN